MQKEGLRFSNDWGRYPHPHPSPPLEGEGVSAFSAMVFFSLPFKGRVGVGMGDGAFRHEIFTN